MNERYLELAYEEAAHSWDTSSQNGATLVSYSGTFFAANNFPEGIKLAVSRLERPLKYLYTEHAERAVIFKAVKAGAHVNGSYMYCPWAACADCARAIIGVGIVKLIRHKEAMDRIANPMWSESIEHADIMMREAGIEIEEYDSPIARPTLLFNGKPW